VEGAESFILIVCRRRVLAFDVLNLGTAIKKPHLSKLKNHLLQFKRLTKNTLYVNLDSYAAHGKRMKEKYRTETTKHQP
jgi:hypothetical protein